ncbi:invasion associated locus B family protein [Hoeflea prorocentri]|uniref:Invasion associated locus B family protein n=1 Tax=Hoeflea prorocentri TaxID=1922333 RepID=A0A9X3ZG05_9HYPH|nr:invasion associated locus B family protein [Hoeflea prorocentri]MCY6379422.1 invasion associated locus B family protein [Hoeflea prorocentri]MDA5397223.1 invasion associated locus B family protein [Hoeflea prorocentri]
MYSKVISLSVAAVLLGAGSSEAQQTAPSLTTATYDAWTVRCAAVSQGEDARSICELVQAARLRGSGQTVLETAIGRLNQADPFKVVFKVPKSVWLRKPVVLLLNEGVETEFSLNASYMRCNAQACIADVEIDKHMLAQVIGASNAAVTFTDIAQKPIRIPLTMRGLDAAFSATFTSGE